MALRVLAQAYLMVLNGGPSRGRPHVWPPFLLRVCELCRRMVLTHQKRWLHRVKAITRRTVIFSGHQGNPIVADMFRGLAGELHLGVNTHTVHSFGSGKAEVLLYLVNGTAGAGD